MADQARNEPVYVPDQDDAALMWLLRFHAAAVVNPNAFGFDARDIESLGRQIDEFRSRLAATAPDDPSRISLAKVAAAAEARAAAIRTIERLVKALLDDPLSSEDDFRTLGITFPGGGAAGPPKT